MENKSDLKPFVKNLPLDTNDYFRILEESETHTMRSGLVTLKAGENVGEHTTNEYEEMLVILEGKGVAEIVGKDKMDIEKGKIVYIPPKTVHNVFNNGSSLLKYIYIVAKAI